MKRCFQLTFILRNSENSKKNSVNFAVECRKINPLFESDNDRKKDVLEE